MKKTKQFIYYIILLLICLVGVVPAVSALSKTQEAGISDHCETIKDNLKTIQKSDARARVYLGGRFETILNKYVTPLNVRLVENSMSTASLIESQNTLTSNKTKFTNDYVGYQQKLEELVAMDCKNEPASFYEKLKLVREERKKVEKDVQKMKTALSEYVELVGKLKERLNAESK
ncbi:hypothetical protein IJI28_01175 [Candidatus Saccharibacteria bacterium]|nr:hypothetical protein [Candidatus Saccharibacteria bacterium]